MRACEVIDDLFDAFFCCSRAYRRTSARAETFGHFNAELHPVLGRVLLQRLRVGVGHNKIYALKLLGDHVVDGIAARTAYTKYGDLGAQLFLSGHRKVQGHAFSACVFSPPARASIVTLLP